MAKDKQRTEKGEQLAAAFAAAISKTGKEQLQDLGAIGRETINHAIGYYELRIPGVRRWAKLFRVTALAFGMLATLAPLVISLLFSVTLKEHSGEAKDWIGIAAIFAVLALALVGIDRLFGFSGSWIRYISATLDLQSRRTAFTAAWLKLSIQAGTTPTAAQVTAALDVLAGFMADIDGVVRSETQSWVSDFRGALDELEKRIAAQQQEYSKTTFVERGAVQLKITNFAELDEGKVQIQLGSDAPFERIGSSTIVLPGLPSGIAHLLLQAKIGGKVAATERACTVESGKITAVETTIPDGMAALPPK